MTKSPFSQITSNGVIEQGGFVDPRDGSGGGNTFLWLRQFVKRRVVDAAPEELAICEFDCRKAQCEQDEWAACERRIHRGAGELFPDSRQP
jgi:hypothetical protein